MLPNLLPVHDVRDRYGCRSRFIVGPGQFIDAIGTAARRVSLAERPFWFSQSITKSFHRQGAKTAKKSLHVRPFSVPSVFSVSPW